MLIKSLICTVCLSLLSVAGIAAANVSAENNYRTSAISVSTEGNTAVLPDDDYVYERVLIDGVWWIFVYTPDGSFVDAYPDEDM